MSDDDAVSGHYRHGDLLGAIEAALGRLGKTTDSLTIEDLAPVDEFHIGGRRATENFLDQLDFSTQDHVLDVGCGLGGASRFAASRYGMSVTGIDLTEEYIETGNVLCRWVKLNDSVTLQRGSALSMPFEPGTFDGGYMMHVGMNIADKARLFAEIFRVLRPGASFGVYDVMRRKAGQLTYPVPWATEDSASALASPDQYEQALRDAGFIISKQNNRRDFALNFFQELRVKTKAKGGPPPLGLHTLMQESASEKLRNLVDGIAADCIAPVEIIALKG